MRAIRIVLASAVAGILSAFLFIGVGSRAAMKFIALITGQQLTLSIEGTLAALVFSTSIGVAGGMLFPVVQRLLPESLKARGGAFGLLLFVVLIPMLPASMQEEVQMIGEYIPLAITVFGLLLIGYGVVLEAMAHALIDISSKQSSAQEHPSYERSTTSTIHLTNHNHISRSTRCILCESSL